MPPFDPERTGNCAPAASRPFSMPSRFPGAKPICLAHRAPSSGRRLRRDDHQIERVAWTGL